MPNIDYSNKMPGTIFSYDEDFYTDDLPDPQIDPVLPGARVPLKKVGIAPAVSYTHLTLPTILLV